MDKIIAGVFVVFLLVLYSTIALAFVVTGIRSLLWAPLKRKFSPQHPERSPHRINSASQEESPS